jgi:hypothetical protein
MNNTKTTIFFAVGVLILGSVSTANAHDTTRIHPLITDHIRMLIKSTDTTNHAYDEIYKIDQAGVSINWGRDPNISFIPEEKEYYSDFIKYNNVIDGVVQEDVPWTKVLGHFYQAETGIPLTVHGVTRGLSSKARAAELFAQSLDWYSGYTKELGEYITNAQGKDIYVNWGNDADDDKKPTTTSEVMNDNWSPFANYNNVTDGVVQEDAPALGVCAIEQE